MGLVDKVKKFCKDNIWAVGFGLGYGLIYGNNFDGADIARDVGMGAMFFGVAFPAFYKMQGHYRTWGDAAKVGAKGAAAYAAANMTGRVIRNLIEYVT